jgi:hypothetical protein
VFFLRLVFYTDVFVVIIVCQLREIFSVRFINSLQTKGVHNFQSAFELHLSALLPIETELPVVELCAFLY